MNLLVEIEDLLNLPARCGNTHVLAIDGPAGAGKTTLANELLLALSLHHTVNLIHLDDLYAGWDLALGPTLSASLSDLLESIAMGVNAKIPVYDWAAEKFNVIREIPVSDLLIIEGVGSAQKLVREYATVTIWMDIDPQTGLQRVLDRDGVAIRALMSQWQIQEGEHFKADATRENVDFILSTLE